MRGWVVLVGRTGRTGSDQPFGFDLGMLVADAAALKAKLQASVSAAATEAPRAARGRQGNRTGSVARSGKGHAAPALRPRPIAVSEFLNVRRKRGWVLLSWDLLRPCVVRPLHSVGVFLRKKEKKDMGRS